MRLSAVIVRNDRSPTLRRLALIGATPPPNTGAAVGISSQENFKNVAGFTKGEISCVRGPEDYRRNGVRTGLPSRRDSGGRSAPFCLCHCSA